MDRKVISMAWISPRISIGDEQSVYIYVYFKFKGTNLSQIQTFSTKIVIEARLIYN